jgi:primosomal protein N' (replication factor Y)
VLAEVAATPAVVLATPGAEPVAPGGYAAAILLDAWVPLARPDLRAAEEALRRWTAAAALVRPDSAGGRVVLVGEASLPVVQALVRWDHAGHAARELAERTELSLPPSAVMAEVLGTAAGVAAFTSALRLPPSAQLLGPVPVDVAPATSDGDQQRLLVRAPLEAAAEVARALAGARGVLSAAKTARPPRVRMVPDEIG